MADHRAAALYYRRSVPEKVVSIEEPLLCVTVVIVNYNSGKLLARCLQHLAQQTVAPERVLVVDNASTDGSCDLIDVSGRTTLIRAGQNLGFAAGNNLALAECATPFIALLNPDAFPETDWLETLLKAADKHPEYAMFGSRLVSAENPLLLDGDGDHYHVSGVVWREGHMQAVKPAAAPWEVFSPCAAAAMYRTGALREVGGFDDDFFCYLEDVDLGFRLRLKGHRCLQIPDAVVHHLGAATTGGQRGVFTDYHGHRNLVWVYVKNMPWGLFWLFLPLHVFVNLVAIGIGFRRGHGKVMLRAKADAVAAIPKVWRKRARIQSARSVSAMEILRILDKRTLR
jgi:GT2 family glycosyltransferase